MRSSAIALGVALVFAAGSAHAAVIYDTINNMGSAFNLGSVDVTYNQGGGGPIGASFYTSSAVTLTSVSLELSATTNDDGGITSIYLVADDGSGGAPGKAGSPTYTGTGASLAFTNATLLGTINNLSLTNSPATKTLSISKTVASGEYWIAAVTTSGSSTQWWYANTGNAGIGITNQNIFDQYGAGGTPESYGADYGPYELAVSGTPVPEPASLAILGVALAGLGLVRRRRKTV